MGLNHSVSQSAEMGLLSCISCCKNILIFCNNLTFFLSPHKRVKKLHLRHWSCYVNKSWVSHIAHKVSWTPQPAGAEFSGQVTLLFLLMAMCCTLLHIPAVPAGVGSPQQWLLILGSFALWIVLLLVFCCIFLFSVQSYFICLIHH